MKLSRSIIQLSLLTGFLALAATVVQPAQAQERPTPTIKACHICDEGLSQAASTPQPVVRAVLFWMNGCPQCHEVLDNVLPPLREKYSEQLEILLVEVVTMDDVDRLYEVAAAYAIPRERVRVPFLVISEHVLIGSAQIPAELPGLIDEYLSQGGVDWSQGLAPQPSGTATPLVVLSSNTSSAVVQAILFTTLDCHSCQLETGAALTPVLEKYGAQFEYRTIDIVTSEDVEYLYQVVAGYGIPREQVDLPLLIIGNDVLIGEQMGAELPGLVAEYLAAGGVEAPVLPSRFATPTPKAAAAAQPGVQPRPNGFTLAIVVMIGMFVALFYAIGRLIFGLLKNSPVVPPPAWQDWAIPILCVIGLGVAGYLSYIEITLSQAACGPVGDCNAVQASRYARLWDVLPVGVLGAVGYVGILAAWWAGRKKWGWVSSYAPIALFGMAFFGTLFSAYLTYLETFVIKAVCLWCLSSAVIITLLLLLSLNHVLRALTPETDDAA